MRRRAQAGPGFAALPAPGALHVTWRAAPQVAGYATHGGLPALCPFTYHSGGWCLLAAGRCVPLTHCNLVEPCKPQKP